MCVQTVFDFDGKEVLGALSEMSNVIFDDDGLAFLQNEQGEREPHMNYDAEVERQSKFDDFVGPLDYEHQIMDGLHHSGDIIDRDNSSGSHLIDVTLGDLWSNVHAVVFTMSAYESASLKDIIKPSVQLTRKSVESLKIETFDTAPDHDHSVYTRADPSSSLEALTYVFEDDKHTMPFRRGQPSWVIFQSSLLPTTHLEIMIDSVAHRQQRHLKNRLAELEEAGATEIAKLKEELKTAEEMCEALPSFTLRVVASQTSIEARAGFGREVWCQNGIAQLLEPGEDRRFDFSRVSAARFWRVELSFEDDTTADRSNLELSFSFHFEDLEEICSYEPAGGAANDDTGDRGAIIMAALHRPTCDGNWTITAIGDACDGNATNYDELRRGLAQLTIDGCKPFIPRYESSTGEPEPDPEPESGPESKPGEWSPKLDLEPESKSEEPSSEPDPEPESKPEEPSSEPDPEPESKPEPDPDSEPMVKLLNKFKERVDKMDDTVNDPRIDAVLDISRKLCRMGGAVPLLGPALNVVSEILDGVEQARENINDLIEVWRVKKRSCRYHTHAHPTRPACRCCSASLMSPTILLR